MTHPDWSVTISLKPVLWCFCQTLLYFTNSHHQKHIGWSSSSSWSDWSRGCRVINFDGCFHHQVIRSSSFIKIVNRQHSAVLQSADFYLRLDIVRGEGLAHVCFCSLTCSGSAGVKLQFFSPIRWHWTILPEGNIGFSRREKLLV